MPKYGLENLQQVSELYGYDSLNLLSCWTTRETLEMQPRKDYRGQPIGRPTIVSVCCARTYYDPVSHISNLTITTCTDGTTVKAYRRWGTRRKHLVLQCVSVLSDRRAGTLSSYLYQREIQPGEPVSPESPDLERKMGCQSTIPQAVMKNRPTRRPHMMLTRFHL